MRNALGLIILLCSAFLAGCGEQSEPEIHISPAHPEPGDAITARYESREQGQLWAIAFFEGRNPGGTANVDVRVGTFQPGEVISVRAASQGPDGWRLRAHELVGNPHRASASELHIIAPESVSPGEVLRATIEVPEHLEDNLEVRAAFHFVTEHGRAGGLLLPLRSDESGNYVLEQDLQQFARRNEMEALRPGDLTILEVAVREGVDTMWRELEIPVRATH